MIYTSIARGMYECYGEHGEKYIVDIENQTCLCKGWYYKKKCKHLDLFNIRRSKDEKKNNNIGNIRLATY